MIETERLILRPFTENDATDAFEYLHEPMVHCFACMKTETMEDAKKAVLDRAKDGEYFFAITLKENGKVIGEIDAMPETHAPDEENAVLDTFSPCWMLNPEYHGKGYAKESMIALFDYLRTLGITNFSAGTAINNTPSVKLLTSLGFKLVEQEKVSFYKDADGNDIVFDGGIFEYGC